MYKARTFSRGDVQCIELPEDFRIKEDEVVAKKVGDMVLLFPQEKGWALFRESLTEFSEDFMVDRDQPRLSS